MTRTPFIPTRLTPSALAPSTTIYRDTPLPDSRRRSTPPPRSGFRTLAWPDESISDGILLGLAALMLPTVVYSLWQACSLVSTGSLEHAVRAFLP